ncbi:MAG: DUF1730 domain-containing protein [Clostridia bacterium]|nr:DUF1730 domain-containing protein [Clostridia bacterium]
MAYRVMIKEEIRKIAKKIGIEKIGFGEKSVVALFPYFVKGETGNVSMYARGMDYHHVAEEKLKQIEKELKAFGARETLVHVDKGGLDDRGAALSAGLGFLGKNGMVICEEFGSYFFIGQVVHDLNIEKDSPIDTSCLSCGACIRACPGGALSDEGFEIEKCLSEITQKKGELQEDERKLVADNGLCWGCDVCQRVCPHNKGLATTAIPEFLKDRITDLNIGDVENLSNREFKEKYGNYAFSWRGKAVLERNLNILFEKEKL